MIGSLAYRFLFLGRRIPAVCRRTAKITSCSSQHIVVVVVIVVVVTWIHRCGSLFHQELLHVRVIVVAGFIIVVIAKVFSRFTVGTSNSLSTWSMPDFLFL